LARGMRPSRSGGSK
jgi:hypothetical protein